MEDVSKDFAMQKVEDVFVMMDGLDLTVTGGFQLLIELKIISNLNLGQ